MKIQIHESVGPLLRGIGWSIVLIGTIAGAVQVRTRAQARQQAHAPARNSIVSPQDNTLETLAQEVADLRETVQEENVVEDVLTTRWFEIFGFVGSCITATSFYAEWLSKRSKPFS